MATQYIDLPLQSGGTGAVDSVNGQVGTVVITYADLGPVPTPSGTANTMAGYDNAGDLGTIPGFFVNTTSGGMDIQLNQLDNNLSQNVFTHNLNTYIRPLQNSPNESTTLLNLAIQVDPDSSGFTIGTSGDATTVLNINTNHQGTSDIGRIANINSNYTIGNGTDAITTLGASHAYGFGTISNNVTIDGQLQGWGFQPNVASGAIGTSNFFVRGFYDFANINIPVQGYDSFISSPTISAIVPNRTITV